MELPLGLAAILMDAAVATARRNIRNQLRSRRPRRGTVLQPGLDTPQWNALADAVEAQLTRRGERTRLARILGLPRQRVHEMIRARRHLPDAERTLLLLAWLNARFAGMDLG